MQWRVFLVVTGIDVGILVLAAVQLGTGPLEDHLEAVGTTPLVLVGPCQARLQRPLGQQDVRSHAQHVQRRLIVHIALVRVAILTEEEGPEVERIERRGSGRMGERKNNNNLLIKVISSTNENSCIISDCTVTL